MHGTDGLGNIAQSEPTRQPIEASAAEFIVSTARRHPGEVTLLAIGRLTNLALRSLRTSASASPGTSWGTPSMWFWEGHPSNITHAVAIAPQTTITLKTFIACIGHLRHRHGSA